MIVSLELLKRHARVDDVEDGKEDDYLQFLLEAAEQQITTATNRTIEELTVIGGGQFPKVLVQAIIMLAAHWYDQRETASSINLQPVPYTIEAITRPFRKLSTRE